MVTTLKGRKKNLNILSAWVLQVLFTCFIPEKNEQQKCQKILQEKSLQLQHKHVTM
jgi:hypothetical protein